MALAVVQKVKAIGNLVTSVTTGAISTTTGNLLVADMSFYTGNGLFSSINDTSTGNNTWSVARAVDASAASAQISQYYAKNITGHASETVTVTPTAAGYIFAGIVEISGAHTTSPLDVGGNATTSTTTSHPVSTSSPTTVNGTIAVALCSSMAISSPLTEDAAYTAQNSDVTVSSSFQGTRIVSATGTQTRTVTSGLNANYNLHIATYKIAAAGGSQFIPIIGRGPGMALAGHSGLVG